MKINKYTLITIAFILSFSNQNLIAQNQDNLKIIFYRHDAGALFIMDHDGKNQKQLGRPVSRPDHYPSVSHDGKRIVFESYRRGGWKVWISNSDGSNAKRLINSSNYNFDPSFSPKGNEVLFMMDGDIYAFDLKRDKYSNVTKTKNVFEFSPYYSPDGNKIAFVSDEDGDNDIYIMNKDGSGKVNLTNDSKQNDYAPTWSPDGKQILFYSDRSGSFELYIMNTDGTNPHFFLDKNEMKKERFTKAVFVNAYDNNNGAYLQYKTSFSHDGSKIAFSRKVDSNREIFTVNRNGRGIKRITFNNHHDGFPVWIKK